MRDMKRLTKNKYRILTLAVLIWGMLSACDGSVLTGSAQELTDGVGAGLSEYQE